MSSNVKAFEDTLPPLYSQEFEIDRAPNPKLCEYLFNFYRDKSGDSRSFGRDDRSGLLLTGNPRSGKTRAAVEVVRRSLTRYPGNSGSFISAVQWANTTTRKAFKCELDDWVYETLQFGWKASTAFLIVDDLDKVRVSASVQSEIFNLIETATTNEINLIVTTNCGAKDLSGKFDEEFGAAIVERLKEFCTPINFSVPFQQVEPTPGNVIAMGKAAND